VADPGSSPTSSRGRFTPETASAAGRRGAAERERRFLGLTRDLEHRQMRRVRSAKAILTMCLGPKSRRRKRLSPNEAELARALIPRAALVLAEILTTGEERPRYDATIAYIRSFYPLPPLLEPLKGSRSYRIRRLGWRAAAGSEEFTEFIRACFRGESVMGQDFGDLYLPSYRSISDQLISQFLDALSQ